jgi:hypothetical protein
LPALELPVGYLRAIVASSLWTIRTVVAVVVEVMVMMVAVVGIVVVGIVVVGSMDCLGFDPTRSNRASNFVPPVVVVVKPVTRWMRHNNNG